MKKVTAYFTVKNQQETIVSYLNSLKDFDRVFVMDLGSEDNTLELLRAYGHNVEVCELGSLGNSDDPVDYAQCNNILMYMALGKFAMESEFSVTLALNYGELLDVSVDNLRNLPNVLGACYEVPVAQLRDFGNNQLGVESICNQVRLVSFGSNYSWSNAAYPVLNYVATDFVDMKILCVGELPIRIHNTETLFQSDPSNQLYAYQYADDLLRSSKYEAAESVFITSLAGKSELNEPLIINTHIKLFNLTGDIGYAYQALAYDPTNPEALYNLAFAFNKAGQYWQAIGILHQLLSKQQGSDNLSVSKNVSILGYKAAHLLAVSYYSLDSDILLGEAFKYIQTAYKSCPYDKAIITDYNTMAALIQEKTIQIRSSDEIEKVGSD